jgi:hypothetical protein
LTKSPLNASPLERTITTNFLTQQALSSGQPLTVGTLPLGLAKILLRDFLFVGLTEELDISFPPFLQGAREHGFALRQEDVAVENSASFR